MDGPPRQGVESHVRDLKQGRIHGSLVADGLAGAVTPTRQGAESRVRD